MQKIAQRLFHSTMVCLPHLLLFSSISHLDRINFMLLSTIDIVKMEMMESNETMTFRFLLLMKPEKIGRIKERRRMPNACACSCCEHLHTFTKFMFDVITFLYNETERNEKDERWAAQLISFGGIRRSRYRTDVLFSVVDCRFINAFLFSYINAIRRRAVDGIFLLPPLASCYELQAPAGVHRIRCALSSSAQRLTHSFVVSIFGYFPR